MNDGHINASMDIDNASLDVTFGEVYEIDKGMPAAIIANLYSSQSTYSPGDYVIYRIRLYKCLVAIETPEEFDSTKWELVKVAEELKEKADKSTTYTKTETDVLLDEKADATSVYTKTEADALLDEKADLQSTLAALSTLSDAIATKADAAGTTAALALKADTSYVDTEFDKKADKSSTYTKTEVDTALASKAAADSVYTKLETDEAISDATKAIDANFALEFNPDWTYESGEFCVYEGRFKRCVSGYNEPKPFDENDWEDVGVGQLIWRTEATISDGLNGKMDKSNPTGTGTLNINRKAGTTVGEQSVAIGYNSTASGEQSIAGGYSATASNTVSVALGNAANASGFAATAFGTSTRATGNYSQAEGYQTRAGGGSSHAEGNQSYASGGVSHAEGYSTQASGQYSHAEGNSSVAEGSTSHAEGHSTTASGDYSHAEGRESIASAYSCHAEGLHTQATQNYSHSEGCRTTASGHTSHAEGYESTASGDTSHAEGYETTASGTYSHAEGNNTTANSYSTHAEGDSTIASGDSSHAEGYDTTASGDYSHAEGSRTIANHKSQHVFGEYNAEDNSENEQSERGNYVEIVGNGYWDSEEEEAVHSNARTLDWSGNEVLAGDLTYNGNKSLTSEVQRLDGRINTKVNSSDVYTKTEMDSQLQSKANTSSVYTKTEVNTKLNAKANTSSVYTKTEVNTKLNAKANVNDVYTKVQVESRLSAKANTSDVYTKSQTDNLLNDKANVTDLPDMTQYYNKSEVDELLDEKADKSNTYTKAQVDDIVYNILPDDTASSSVANFNTSLELPIKSLGIDVNAVQDLHGQSGAYLPGGSAQIWDEEWELGSYNSVGEPSPSTSMIRTKNFIPCEPDATYFSKVPSGTAMVVFMYDSNHEYISDATKTNQTFTTPNNARYLRFRMSTQYGTTYKNDISINYPATDTAYHPYANICPISGWSEISLYHRGANLFNKAIVINGYYIVDSTGIAKPDANSKCTDFIEVKGGATYAIMTEQTSGGWGAWYDKNKNFISAIIGYAKATPTTYTAPSNAFFARLTCYRAGVGNIDTFAFNTPRTATTYEPYTGTTEVINLGGTYYGGHFTQDKTGHRQFEVTHALTTVSEMDNNRSWYYSTSNGFWINEGLANTIVKTASGSEATTAISDYFETVSRNNLKSADDRLCVNTSGYVCIYGSELPTTKNEFLSSVGNAKLVYPLATPYIINLPDGDPIITLNGTNNIYADTGDTSVVFKDSVNGYVEKKIASVQALALNT